jgi:hypothetical protein
MGTLCKSAPEMGFKRIANATVDRHTLQKSASQITQTIRPYRGFDIELPLKYDHQI